MKVLITGGSGLIGSALAADLYKKGFEIAILGRSQGSKQGLPYRFYKWDIETGYIDKEAVAGTNYIVHLAGENISEKRWTSKQKAIIENSRVKSTEILFKACKENNVSLKAFVSTSAIGYYGTFTSEKILDESDGPGNDFLAQIGEKWEQAAGLFKEISQRTVVIRTGVVLSHLGAAYVKMAKPILYGFGAGLGNGNQYVPWIHLDDIATMFTRAIEDEKMDGIYNGVAPQHITNNQLTKAIAASFGKRIWSPNIPAFLIKLVFGEMSGILLKGTRISAEKIIKAGFSFKYPDIEKALADLAVKFKSLV